MLNYAKWTQSEMPVSCGKILVATMPNCLQISECQIQLIEGRKQDIGRLIPFDLVFCLFPLFVCICYNFLTPTEKKKNCPKLSF